MHLVGRIAQRAAAVEHTKRWTFDIGNVDCTQRSGL